MNLQKAERRLQPWPVQVFDLYLLGLSNWRWSWRSAIVVDTISPLIGMIVLAVFGRDFGPTSLAYVMTGNVVLSLMFGNSRKMCGHVTSLRMMGGLDYYATLPVSKTALIMGISAAFVTLSLPSVTLTILIGALILGVPLQISPLVLLVIPMCAAPLAGIGAYIAFSVRNPESAGAWELLFMLLLTGLGPIIIPPDRLNPMFNTLSYLSPARYAASALRATLLGPITGQLAIDMAILLSFTILILAFVVRRMDWRVTV